MTAREAYDQLVAHSVLTAQLTAGMALLDWDQQVMLPPAAYPGRAEQLGALTAVIHRRCQDPAIGDWLAVCEGSALTRDPLSVEAVNLRGWRRDYDQAVKIPESLAVALARAASAGQRAWEMARADNDFAAFAPHLDTLLSLTLEKAAALGYAAEPYDALLDLFEPGATTAAVAGLLTELRDATVPLLEAVRECPRPRPLPPGPYPIRDQEALAKRVMRLFGLPESASRLDVSVHPFSTMIGPFDTRITIRYDEADFTNALLSAAHETGHSLYSLGHTARHYGTPMGEEVSLGVHESQSRLWENMVGRSLPFWECLLPEATARFPALAACSPTDMFRALGAVTPGCIRVDADETTYNLHIILRFELELALTRGELAVADLPAAWNERCRRLLGLTPPNDAMGVLQDVHWATGEFGYFPTYSLGNIYAACLFAAARRDLPELDADMAAGRFEPLRRWLDRAIYSKGRQRPPSELVAAATGEVPSAAPLIAHLQAKAAAVYGI